MEYVFKIAKGMAKLRRGSRAVVADACRIQNPPDFKRKMWKVRPGESEWHPPVVTYTDFFDHETRKFPAGLIEKVCATLEKSGNTVQLHGYKTKLKAEVPPDYCHVLTARKDQIDGVNELLKHKYGSLEMPTGGGKTLMMALLCSYLHREHGLRVLVMVPSRTLMTQTYDSFSAFIGEDIPIGRIGGGRKETDCGITIGIPNTLYQGVPRKIEIGEDVKTVVPNSELHDFLHSIDVVAVDECQYIGADTWYATVLESAAKYRYSFSGTVETDNSLKDTRRRAICGPIRYRVPIDELVKLGVIARACVYFLTDPDIYDELPGRNDYRFGYDGGIVNNTKYNRFITRLIVKLAAGRRRVIVNVRRQAHGKFLQEAAARLGLKANYIDGKTPIPQIEKFKGQLDTGEVQVIIATKIFDVGVDMPRADSLVLAGGEKARIGLRQRLGRVLRVTAEKTTAAVFDFSHDAHWYTVRHAIERLRTYEKEGFEVINVKSQRDIFQIAERKNSKGKKKRKRTKAS